jgi:hypothetical protein
MLVTRDHRNRRWWLNGRAAGQNGLPPGRSADW